MTEERRGVLSAAPTSPDGRRLLTTSEGESMWVAADATPADLATRHGLDRVVVMPPLPDCVTGMCLDGPLAGVTVSYVLNEKGRRAGYAVSRRAGTTSMATYEVERIADGGRPAELRHVPDPAG